MVTIKLREKEYKLGYFTEVHLLPLARFFIQMKEQTIDKELWQELAETLTDIIIPNVDKKLVNPEITRGIFLTSEEFLTVYKACIQVLKETGQLTDRDIEEIESDKETKEDQIEILKAQLKALENK